MGHYHTNSPENGKKQKIHKCIYCHRNRYEKFLTYFSDYNCWYCKDPDRCKRLRFRGWRRG